MMSPTTPAAQLAVKFHETYERLAPSFGYETREDTKQFDPESKNGKLMIAVCEELNRTGALTLPPYTPALQTPPPSPTFENDPSLSDIERTVYRNIWEQIGCSKSDVVFTARLFDELGADSLDNVELAMALEEEFEVEISDLEAGKWVTVQDVVDCIKRLTKKTPA